MPLFTPQWRIALSTLMLTGVLLSTSDAAAQSAEPDSIFLVDGRVIVVRVTGLIGENVRTIPPGEQTQDLPLAGIEKIVDARGRVIYWRNRVSSKGFSQYLARSHGRQIILEVGATLDRRHGRSDNPGDEWTQFTPRIGWVYSPGLTIELSGGRKTFDGSTKSGRWRKMRLSVGWFPT